MGAIDEILSSIDSAQLAAALGTDEETARTAAAAAIPTLINSLQANAASPDGEGSLLEALGQHADGVYGDTVDLDAVDTDDGRKIVAHALADDPQRLQALGGLGGGLLSKLLPLLAPIVMSYLAKKLGMGSGRTQDAGGSGDILGDLLGGLLGGGAASGGGGLGDLLGGMLGGGGQPEPATVPAGTGTGGVFNSPGSPSGMQIPMDEGEPTYQQHPQQPGSGDVLGDLLGQILGR